MDTQAALIVLGIVALIVLPFVFRNLWKKTRDAKFVKEFINKAEKRNMAISQKELWHNHYLIGVDNSSKQILYVNKRDEKSEEVLIDLAQVEKCRIETISRASKNKSGKNSDRLEMVFTYRNATEPEKALEFYHSTEFMPTEKEFTIAEKWLGIVNSNLRGNNK